MVRCKKCRKNLKNVAVRVTCEHCQKTFCLTHVHAFEHNCQTENLLNERKKNKEKLKEKLHKTNTDKGYKSI
jgi:hypothetical protein